MVLAFRKLVYSTCSFMHRVRHSDLEFSIGMGGPCASLDISVACDYAVDLAIAAHSPIVIDVAF